MITRLLLVATLATAMTACSDAGDNRAGEKEGFGISGAASGSGATGDSGAASGAEREGRDDGRKESSKP